MVNPTRVYIVEIPHYQSCCMICTLWTKSIFSACYCHTKWYRNPNEVECNFYTLVEEDFLEIYDVIFLIMIYVPRIPLVIIVSIVTWHNAFVRSCKSIPKHSICNFIQLHNRNSRLFDSVSFGSSVDYLRKKEISGALQYYQSIEIFFEIMICKWFAFVNELVNESNRHNGRFCVVASISALNG